MDTYIATTDEYREFYRNRLECLMFSGSKGTYYNDDVDCDSAVVSIIVRDNITSKIFELGVPVVDNNHINEPKEVSEGIGKIRIWNLTPKISPDIDVSKYDIFHGDGQFHPIFCLTFDSEECATAIYEFLTTDKHDCHDVRHPCISYVCCNGISQVECVPAGFMEELYDHLNNHYKCEKEFGIEEKPTTIKQSQIDSFIKMYENFKINDFKENAI